jgi:quercetin dioxygenase-like cupin family protein
MLIEERPGTGHTDERRVIQDLANNIPPGRKWAFIQHHWGLIDTLKNPDRASDTLIIPVEGGLSLDGNLATIDTNKINLNTVGGREGSYGIAPQSQILFLPEGNCELPPIPIAAEVTVLNPKYDGSIVLPPIEHSGQLLDIRFVGRIETLKPGIRLGDHSHRKPDHFEIFFVVSGEASLISGPDTGTDFQRRKAKKGSVIIIPPGIAHTFLGEETFTIVPVSTIPFNETDKDLITCDWIKKVK